MPEDFKPSQDPMEGWAHLFFFLVAFGMTATFGYRLLRALEYL